MRIFYKAFKVFLAFSHEEYSNTKITEKKISKITLNFIDLFIAQFKLLFLKQKKKRKKLNFYFLIKYK